MAPEVLYRVIHGSPTPEPWQKDRVRFQPALLHGYRRHRVRNAEYPGIIAEPSDSDQTAVLGVLVSGLTEADMYRLDRYEGAEYVKQTVRVRALRTESHEDGKVVSGHELVKELDAAGAGTATEGEEVVATTYVWVAGREQLEEREWDFETFKREKLDWWVAMDEKDW
ncbi:hypothetical protein N7539_000407 [Penicillium diatomitis]|uniref:Putative gamma-glutamylcyclotransferase n=1 Tax=Penicillium diatomitis TaxID=2819901 RepID=A0A9W9XLL4_9EURO|nr:uncharacterized protein N7539_000407 [Penicillium diatomitis]KAJ5495291.1 hypothetical protein N7539_000407 [Penicillium diatomitis]